MSSRKKIRMLPGTLVVVRPLNEIIATLDGEGKLDALPFMPEMIRFCGQRFRVSKRIERTCEEKEKSMRRIRDTVFLENLRCDGSSHGGCQKECMIFWKEAWLKKVDDAAVRSIEITGPIPMPNILQCRMSDDQYICQSTELAKATTYLSPFDIRSYFRDIHAQTYTVGKLIRNLSYAYYLRLRSYVTGKSYRVLQGQQRKTPIEVLNLQPGEWVQVKTKKEILKTLDSGGKNRGLAFTVDMVPFCGGTHRVLKRLEKMIYEPERRLIDVKDTVILEGVTCKGCYILRGGCPRENYNFWREIWLKRVPTPYNTD